MVALAGEAAIVKSGWHCGAVPGEARAGSATIADIETSNATRASLLIKSPSNPRFLADDAISL
jgi:hypothetical protein